MNLHDMLLSTTLRGGGSGGGGGSEEEWIGDGNTHIWISLAEGRTSPMLGVGVQGTVTVDWGDGSEPDTLTAGITSALAYTPVHEYGKAGDYVITLTGDGQIGFVHSGNLSCILCGTKTPADAVNMYYRYAIRRIECGKNVTYLGERSLSGCYALERFSFPAVTGTLDNYTFNSCYALREVCIPNGITKIGNYVFLDCYSLTRAHFPASVNSIGWAAFKGCGGVTIFDFSHHTTIPTLTQKDVFTNISSDCIFKIPASLYDEWIAATNWSAIAASYTFVGV